LTGNLVAGVHDAMKIRGRSVSRLPRGVVLDVHYAEPDLKYTLKSQKATATKSGKDG